MTEQQKKLIDKNEQVSEGSKERVYSWLVNEKIRARYSASAEFAILRKMLNGTNAEEFAEYNEFCERCKAEAKAEIE